MDVVAAAIARLRDAGWTVERTSIRRDAPAALTSASPTQLAWASSFTRLSNPDDTTWFLSMNDYAGTSDDAFAWDAIETLSLEAATDVHENALVLEFWRRHRPILLSVRHRYSYLAVRADGVVVHGAEPEFEQTSDVAADLDSLLRSVGMPGEPAIDLVDDLLFG
ncbi:hypothetical protein FB566_1141 [Stackebrandtia endophytica]|uniref:Uncharacterized protein n=1 Tax=Stackebrandtia endophytica TaxID=1496996 RepID=A0A543ASR5_9ACTN|nr:hypothetical protein [Stackebrandtia endophytica]TQL75632.1 hypothetical protein FB566_1141 [Stackebrandtia endophytica]